jgi:hypothetical protein
MLKVLYYTVIPSKVFIIIIIIIIIVIIIIIDTVPGYARCFQAHSVRGLNQEYAGGWHKRILR